ncbi:hypothetical protein M441DRAFT_386669 [Trichoderma asperellum CBS 433.97]|uniref:Uncharacterized protein n=1 Tax=Trichoderma asperellum (strain ATCC 204424 / CBS 433.97 / NBRC 101777) TaxID=1042311 RepID=A0A2T3ZBQ9_TRIA4|nr:hypothetical protein M441DRAFT_386669 [Trichoderma asperellum CBS 433.97]PTB42239.1 hypothetical protein M441DRAFT_386669 [Trichoderma asperellum CBS 433.97]
MKLRCVDVDERIPVSQTHYHVCRSSSRATAEILHQRRPAPHWPLSEKRAAACFISNIIESRINLARNATLGRPDQEDSCVCSWGTAIGLPNPIGVLQLHILIIMMILLFYTTP